MRSGLHSRENKELNIQKTNPIVLYSIGEMYKESLSIGFLHKK